MGIVMRGSKGFRYPDYSTAASPPDDFLNIANDISSYFDNYDAFVNGQVNNSAATINGRIDGVQTNYQNADNGLSSDYNNKFNSFMQTSSWGPTLGGSGATIGNNGGAEGQINRIREECVFRGRIVFGSSASFGTGIATIGGISFGLHTQTALGVGYYTDGNYFIHCVFTPMDSTTFAIRRQKNDGNLGLGYDLGTPPQSAQLVFAISGVRA